MKNIANKVVAFAVTAVALGTAAFSQTQKTAMRGYVPFSFHTSQGTMPAGKYDVIENYGGAQSVYALHNADSNKTVLVGATPVEFKPSDVASITFRCDDGCELTAIRTADRLVEFPQHRSSHRGEVAVIALHRAPANAK